MVLLYMVTWIPSIYPSHVSIYTSTMDPMGIFVGPLAFRFVSWELALKFSGQSTMGNRCSVKMWTKKLGDPESANPSLLSKVPTPQKKLHQRAQGWEAGYCFRTLDDQEMDGNTIHRPTLKLSINGQHVVNPVSHLNNHPSKEQKDHVQNQWHHCFSGTVRLHSSS